MNRLSATVLERAYSIHGIGLVLRAADPGVLTAIDLRLASFALEPQPSLAEARLRLEFLEGRHPTQPEGASRPAYDTAHGSLLYFPEADALCGVFGEVSLDCRLASGVGMFTCPAFTGEDLYLATHPLATICLLELLERQGLVSLHAACLAGRDGDGVLLGGPNGVGKSTLALALARAGMDFLSDDLVFLAVGGNSHPVRALGFPDALEHVGDGSAPAPDGTPRRLCRVEELIGAPPLTFCEPRVLVFPELGADRATELVPVHASEALVRLVPGVLRTEPQATHAHLQAIVALLDQVTCYVLRTGRNLERAVGLLQALV